MNPTDTQLQHALAAELPDIFRIEGLDIYWTNGWEENAGGGYYPLVTDREWPWIVRELEKRLMHPQKQKYADILTGWGMACDAITAPWQARAIAYFKTIGKEIA